jgi:hypothetical protein
MMSQKRLDKNGRWRNVIVAFRVSPEENRRINANVELSGLTKQDYIISCLVSHTVTVYGNPRVFKALQSRMDKIQGELERISSLDMANEETLESVREVILLYSQLVEKEMLGKSVDSS